MASKMSDDFENEWTFVDKDGKVDIEVKCIFSFLSFSAKEMFWFSTLSCLKMNMSSSPST